MNKIAVCEVATICFLTVLTMEIVKAAFVYRREKNKWCAERGCWMVTAVRTGKAEASFAYRRMRRRHLVKSLMLPEGKYVLGNRSGDDIYVDSGGSRRLKVHLNVQNDKILLSVTKGMIRIDNYLYESNSHKQMEMREFGKVTVGDVQLEFVKEAQLC